jgi:hypothetical protein
MRVKLLIVVGINKRFSLGRHFLGFQSPLPGEIELGTLFVVYGYSIDAVLDLTVLKGVVVRVVVARDIGVDPGERASRLVERRLHVILTLRDDFTGLLEVLVELDEALLYHHYVIFALILREWLLIRLLLYNGGLPTVHIHGLGGAE